MSSRSRHRWSIALPIAWAGVIFATSCMVVTTRQLFSFAGSVLGQENLRRFKSLWGASWMAVVKGWHVTEFAVLTALLILAFNACWPNARLRNTFLAAAAALLYAVSDELHQTFVPTRGGTVWDVLIDALGIGLATLVSLRRLDHSTAAAGSSD